MYNQLERLATINREHHAELLHEAEIQRLLPKTRPHQTQMNWFGKFIGRFSFKADSLHRYSTSKTA